MPGREGSNDLRQRSILAGLRGPIWGLALIVSASGAGGLAQAQSSGDSVFPDPGGITVRPASQSPFPDPNGGASSSTSSSSVFPDPNSGQAAPQSAAPASPFPTPGGGGFGPPPSAGGFGGAPAGGGGQQAQQACAKEFEALRIARDNRGKAIQRAMKSKPGPDVACKLFRNFSAAEAKMLQFLKTQSSRCGIPPEIAKQMAKGHAQTNRTTNQICTAAAQPRAPAGPRLSDVLGSPSLPDATTQAPSGGSTFDTINGNVLSR